MTIINSNVYSEIAGYNEQEVRFHVIDPIIRALGYPDTEGSFLNMEERLKYPYVHVGHKSQKDLPVGRADFRAGMKGRRGSFIVEAKSGAVGIHLPDIEQAHSYAAHAEVGANYFVLCDGHQFQIYQTLQGTSYSALIDIHITDINDKFHLISNILSPKRLEANCRVTHDLKLQLVDGLGSSVKIREGSYEIDSYKIRFFAQGQDVTDVLFSQVPEIRNIKSQLELMRQMPLVISEGTVERGEDGRIGVWIKSQGVTKGNLETMRLMGIEFMTFVTSDEFLSSDTSNPTMFETQKDFKVAKGSMVSPLFGDAVEADTNMQGDIYLQAKIVVSNGTVSGSYIGLANYSFEIPMLGQLTAEFDFSGTLSCKFE